MISDQEIWMRAWVAVASTFNAKAPDCTRYADACLKDYRERFPRPSMRVGTLNTGVSIPLATTSDSYFPRAARANLSFKG